MAAPGFRVKRRARPCCGRRAGWNPDAAAGCPAVIRPPAERIGAGLGCAARDGCAADSRFPFRVRCRTFPTAARIPFLAAARLRGRCRRASFFRRRAAGPWPGDGPRTLHFPQGAMVGRHAAAGGFPDRTAAGKGRREASEGDAGSRGRSGVGGRHKSCAGADGI